VEVQWGSDSNFGRHFIPQSEKETSEALEKERLIYMGCLEVNAGTATAQPPSPIQNGGSSPLKLKSKIPAFHMREEEERSGPPRKRRKSKVKGDDEDLEEDTPLATSSKAQKRKPKVDLAGAPPVNEESKKRRKPSGNGAPKQPRENLTEEQKRENHIKSEQKRRTLIKEGFDDLCDIVPGLKGGGFSKSTMLAMAAEWLDDMLKANEKLKAQLAGLEDR
jgi:hypothetical protein